MNINCPDASLIPQLRTLWKEAFGDSDAFLDSFFATGYAPDRCRCITGESRVRAALYWLDMNCGGQKFAYIYAVATAAEARGKGLCRVLMADTAAVLKEAGYHGALLVPQDGGLRAMYGRMGYLPATSINEFFCAAGSACAALREITPEEYAALRPGFAPEGSMELSPGALAFLATQARFYTGAGPLAAVSQEREHLRILEYLGDSGSLPGLVAALGATEATVRTPGNSIPFAMYLPLREDCKKPEYHPYAFD